MAFNFNSCASKRELISSAVNDFSTALIRRDDFEYDADADVDVDVNVGVNVNVGEEGNAFAYDDDEEIPPRMPLGYVDVVKASM